VALISAFGAFLCISMLAYLNSFEDGNLWLIPPFGASMVLVMAVHESPLAHPKNVFFGHILSALAGVIVFSLMGFSHISMGLGVASAIFLMIITKTIHPPAGANPIIAILGAKEIGFIIMPVAAGASFIVIFAIFYNKLLKRNYFIFND
tara:strand:- start:367 stop:813 length:447 start_codon:yes stop_codon:yes gene_type:complete